MQELKNSKTGHPITFLVMVNIPQFLFLGFMFYYGLRISSYLTRENITTFLVLGGIHLFITGASLGYHLVYLKKRKPFPLWYPISLILGSTFFLYFFLLTGLREFPTVPEGIFNVIKAIYNFVGCYVVIIIYTALGLARGSIGKNQKAWQLFLGAILIPGGFFFFFQVILPAFRWYSMPEFLVHTGLIILILLTVLFFYLLFGAFYLMGIKNQAFLKKAEPFLKFFFCLLLPIGGLFYYNFGESMIGLGYKELMGNLENIFYYVLAGLTGISLILPDFKNRGLRTALFFIRILLLPFSLFFFFLFLPLLPLSLIAVAAAGLGLMMISPLFLFYFHITALIRDFNVIGKQLSPGALYLPGLLGLGALPLILLLSFYSQKKVLNQALDYLFNGGYETISGLNTGTLKETLSRIEDNARGIQTPIISPLYNKIVFNNLILSEKKMDILHKVFFNQESAVPPSGRRENGVEITGLLSQSRYIDGHWVSQIDLTILNNETWQQEFRVNFSLPPGAIISDYYLFIDDVKEKGLMVEKRAALWIYNQVISRQRDPGVIYYEDDLSLSLRVFPCFSGVPRKTGFEIIHPEPFTLKLGKNSCNLGTGASHQPEPPAQPGTTPLYFSSREVKKMESVTRKPSFHLIVDCSRERTLFKEEYARLIHQFLASHSPEDVTIHLTDYRELRVPARGSWEEALEKKQFTGAFFLDPTLVPLLREERDQPDLLYPVILLLAPDLSNLVHAINLKAVLPLLPGEGEFWWEDLNSRIFRGSFSQPLEKGYMTPVKAISSPGPEKVWPGRANPRFFFSPSSPGVIFPGDQVYTGGNPQLQGFSLMARWMESELNPGNKEELFLPLVQESIQAKLLTPFTSLIVLENQSQKKAMLKKQEEILLGHTALDVETQGMEPMSEPGLWLLPGIGLFLFLKTKKKQ